MESFWKHYEFIVRNGPNALLVLIVVAWLAADYGYLNSQSRLAAQGIKEHAARVDKVVAERTEHEKIQKALLEKIVDVLEQQRLLQAQTGLLTCLREARNDSERNSCIKQFPLTKPSNGGTR